MNLEQIPLVVTDGFGFYEKAVRRLWGPACLYGRVIKTTPKRLHREGGAKSGAWGQVAIGTAVTGAFVREGKYDVSGQTAFLMFVI